MWMNGLIAHAFGLAVVSRPGAAHIFPLGAYDALFFEGMIGQFMAMAGDSKPNVLNSDLLPFAVVEDADSWGYAPNYILNKEMGSTEALVLTAQAALDWGAHTGDYAWFDALVRFVLKDRLASLSPQNIEAVSVGLATSQLANLVRIIFGDFMTDKYYYREAKNDAIIAEVGELPQEVDLRYGNPVVTEDPATAQDLADRGLDFATRPLESATVQAWMEGARVEIGDIVPVTSAFHNLDQAEFLCIAKTISLDQKRVTLTTARHKEVS
jgi:hypothetical protein